MDKTQRFREIADSLGNLYEKKNKAYGDSFGSTFEKLGIISAVTRISDKYNRLVNLATHPDIDNLGESIEDTLKDMASYCIMTLIELDITTQDYKRLYVGDELQCVKDVVMEEDDVIAYYAGRIYKVEQEGCITDEQGLKQHYWFIDDSDEENWRKYFKKVK